MEKNSINLFYRLLNIWFSYIAVLIISTVLPHWENINFLMWMNHILYFLLFLLTISITIKDPNNKDIFINLSILFFTISFSFINIFIGENYIMGSDKLSYYIFVYKRMFYGFLFNMFIVYTVIKYLLNKKTPHILLYAVTLSIIIPVFLIQFYPYLVNFTNFLKLQNNYAKDLATRIFLNNMLSAIFMLFYGFLLYKKDVILGEYINLLMALVFMYLFFGLINDLTTILHFQIFSVSQYFLTLNLVLMAIVLVKKLCFLCTDYGQFYEHLIRGRLHLGNFKIQRRHYQSNAFVLKVLKIYFSQRRNYVITVIWFSLIIFLYFHFSKFFTVNVAAFFICLIVLFNFINALHKKREKQRHIIQEIIEPNL